MMRCSKAQQWISRQFDGVLGAGQEARLRDHLAKCAACRAYAEALAGLDLHLLEVPEPTPDFTARVVENIEGTRSRRAVLLRRPAVFRPLAAGLGIAAALGGFVIGSDLEFFNGGGAAEVNGSVEVAASEAIDPLAEGSVESVLIAMLSNTEE